MRPACLVTASGGNNRFRNKSNRLHKRHRTNVHHQVNSKQLCFFKSISGKSTSSDGEQERVFRLPASTVPIQDCDSACRKMTDSFPPSVTAGCSRILHSDDLAIQNAASSCETILFPDQANEHSNSTSVVPLRLHSQVLRKPTYRKGDNHREVCIVG